MRVDLTGTTAVVDPNWSTLQYTARCAYTRNDTYLTDVQFSPDGTYFAITATGTTGTNIDGTKALCDSVSRWPADATGSDLTPTWVDWTGQDTRRAGDRPRPESVLARPVDLGRLRPGHSLVWRSPAPRSTSAASAVAEQPDRPQHRRRRRCPAGGTRRGRPVQRRSADVEPRPQPARRRGLRALRRRGRALRRQRHRYVGDYLYKRPKISFFPLAGGSTPASTAVASLPANVYLAGPTSTSGTGPDDLAYRAMSGPDIARPPSSATRDPVGHHPRRVRGRRHRVSTAWPGATPAAMRSIRRRFTSAGVGTPSKVDPYNEPVWTNVQTGSGQTYRGVPSGFYTEISSVTGAFYAGGRLYYTLAGRSSLYWRWFSPDSGVVGGDGGHHHRADFSNVAGLTASGDTIYYSDATTGQLHRMSFAGQTPDPASDTVLSGPTLDGLDWRARSLLLYGPPRFPTYPGPNTPATPSGALTCAQLTCRADASASSDPDPGGAIVYYSWDFGDGSTATGPLATHGYATPGTYTVTLRVIDNRRASSTQTQQITVTAPGTPVSAVGSSNSNLLSAAPSVSVPSGTRPGDTELLAVSTGAAGVSTTPPSGGGWRLLTQRTNVLETDIYVRTATAADPATVTVALSAPTRADLTLSSYRGVADTSASTGLDVNTATHATPPASVTAGGSWVVSYWASRSSTTTTWAPPTGLTVRASGVGTGGGHIDSQTADNARGLAGGTYAGQPASTSGVTSRAITASIVLAPGA